jgi:hypothetical protein
MPATSINTNAKGCLLLIIPTALTISALFIAWPFILGLAILITGGSIWQSYQWSQTVQSINPIFQQTIVQNRGQVSPIDLSLKANISGSLAKKYLDAKADEFGTRPRIHPERGPIYYFVSIGTLGSIFDDIEAEEALPEIPAPPSPVALQPAPATNVVESPPVAEPPTVVETSAPAVELPTSPLSNLGALLDEDIAPADEPNPPIVSSSDQPRVTIIQSELAKRLDVHSSTVYKRRTDPDFTEWTRSRDPEGLAWAYSHESKEYFQVS